MRPLTRFQVELLDRALRTEAVAVVGPGVHTEASEIQLDGRRRLASGMRDGLDSRGGRVAHVHS
ncbi:MAG: hypothetical protein ACRENX_12475 [Candidatus Dormibacteria bacterium]